MDRVIVIGASEGGLEPLRCIVEALPVPCGAAVVVVMHTGPHQSALPFVLSRSGRLAAAFARDQASIEAGRIYVAPPDHHVLLERTGIRLSRGPKFHHTRPAIDPLFISAAHVYGVRVVGVILSGQNGDGALGLREIKNYGGVTVVQHPSEALAPSMPRTAMADHPDWCLSTQEIARRIASLCSRLA